VECELVVVRHGETDWNRELRVQGRTDVALNSRGLAQAKQCAEAIARTYRGKMGPAVVYSSSLQRAAATAAAIADALSAKEVLAVQQDERLNEWDLGVLEGMRKQEAAAQHSQEWALFSQWCSGPNVSQQ
ncbi:unnamed protein product, partial [Polarella glacialis]